MLFSAFDLPDDASVVEDAATLLPSVSDELATDSGLLAVSAFGVSDFGESDFDRSGLAESTLDASPLDFA